MVKPRVVTIDGPAGAGKSTVATRLASRLGWRLLDTGAMYRAVTLAALLEGVDLTDDRALGELAERIEVRLPVGQVLLNGEDVSASIRGIEVTRATRFSADSPSVRKRLVEWQRAFAETERDIVTEGRDQGTIVFPDAFCKFYLTASNDERARRRHSEYAARGMSVSFEEVLRDMIERDAQDSSRAIAPMTPAGDARIVDSTGVDLEELVGSVESVVRSSIDGRID